MTCWKIQIGNHLQGDRASESVGRSMGIGVCRLPREAGGWEAAAQTAGARGQTHRKPRAWLTGAEGKFQTPEAVPWGHRGVFIPGFLKQTTTKKKKQPQIPDNNNKKHPTVGVFRNEIQ